MRPSTRHARTSSLKTGSPTGGHRRGATRLSGIAALAIGLLLAFSVRGAFAQGLSDEDRLVFADGLFSRGMYELAIREYNAFIEAAPQNPKSDIAYFRLGECHRRLKDFRSAEKQYKYVYDNFPASEYRLKAGFRRADLFLEQEQYESAADLFGAVLKQNPPDDVTAASLYFRALSLQKLGRNAEGIEALERLRTGFTSSEYSAYALITLAGLYGRATKATDTGVPYDPDKAAAFYKAVAANPLSPRVGAEAMFQLGDLQFRLKNYEKSAEAYRKLLAAYPEDPRAAEARLQAAWAAHNAGLYAEALQNADQILASPAATNDPSTASLDEWLYLKANCERQLTRNEEATKTYAALLQGYQTSSFVNAARYEKALTLHRMQRHAEAIKDALGVELTDRLRKDTYWLLGESYAALKDSDKAIQYYRLIVKDYPDSDMARDATYRLAYHLQEKKQYAEASRFYLMVPARYADSELAPTALFASGTCLALNNQHAEAVRDWLQLVQKYPSSPLAEEAMFQKGMSEIRLKRDADAVTSLEQLLRQSPRTPFAADAWYWKGLLLQDARKWQDAEAALRQALAAGPRDELLRDIEIHLAGILQTEDKKDEAAAIYQRLIGSPARSKLSPTVLEWMAEYLFEKREFTASADAARQLTEKPVAALQQTGWALLGRAQLTAGEKDKARTSFTQALAVKAKTRFCAEAALHLGEMELAGGDADKAAQLFAKAAAMATGDDMLQVRARAYAGLGRTSKAAGKMEDAARYFMGVAVLYDDPALVPECMFEAALAFEAGGKAAEAAKVRQELRTRYPVSEWANRAQP
jgi:TolA-binding protein